MIPPIGRDMKPTKNVVYASKVPTTASKFGKNSLFNTSGVTTPYRKKSYHSIVVPIALAKATTPGEIAGAVVPGFGRSIVVPPSVLPSVRPPAVSIFAALPPRWPDGVDICHTIRRRGPRVQR